MLKLTKRKAIEIFRYFAQSAAANGALNKEEKYKFDLKYAIKKYDRNYEQVKALVTIKNETFKYKEPVIIFPGFEGRLDGVESLVRNLKRPVHCVQYPFEKSQNSIAKTTDSIIQVLNENSLLEEDNLNILGHSYGGILAVELVRRLEEKNKKIRLCLTDSSPYAIKIMIAQSFGDIHEVEEFHLNLILTLAKDAGYRCDKQLMDLVKSHFHWEDKINATIPLIAEKTGYDIEHLKTIASSASKILQAIYNYNENDEKLNAETTLIRSSIKTLPFPEDFKLSEICKKPIKEFRTDGHHFNMLKSLQTANLVNKVFSQKK